MPPKPQSSRTKKPSSNTGVGKRKKPRSGEQTSEKRPRRHSPEDKAIWRSKQKNAAPLQAEVLQHVESCITTAVMSVLSRKKVPAFQPIQVHLSLLQQRLLHLCKDMRVPATKLGKLRNLARDVQEEQRKMEECEDTLQSLDHDIEEAVQMTEKIEEDTATVEGKIETLKQQENPQITDTDPLPLPHGTFQAPAMQDLARKLHNPDVVLKEVSRVRSHPVYERLQNLLPMCYAEISSL